VKGRFDASGLGLVATLRKDGTPRISGIEPMFLDGDLWLGMMPGSRKAVDLQRDGRFALHSGTADKDVSSGDAKLTGVAQHITDPDTITAIAMANFGPDADPMDMTLFQVRLTEASFLTVEGDHLIIESWSSGNSVRRTERR
jgi:hypothetical protein